MLTLVGRVAKTASLILMFAAGVTPLAGAVATDAKIIREAQAVGGSSGHGY